MRRRDFFKGILGLALPLVSLAANPAGRVIEKAFEPHKPKLPPVPDCLTSAEWSIESVEGSFTTYRKQCRAVGQIPQSRLHEVAKYLGDHSPQQNGYSREIASFSITQSPSGSIREISIEYIDRQVFKPAKD